MKVLANVDSFRKGCSYCKKLIPYLIVITIFIATIIILKLWIYHRDERASARFNNLCENVIIPITNKLHSYKMIIQGAGGMFATSEKVTSKKWETYFKYRNLEKYYPGVHGLGFYKIVPANDLEKFIQMVRAEGFSDYNIFPPGKRDVYAPLLYIEPLDKLRSALGFDAYSEPARKTTLEQAIINADAVLTQPLTLATSTNTSKTDFLLFLPIYKTGIPPATIAERRTSIDGFAAVGFRITNFIRAIFPNSIKEVSFEIYSGEDASPSAILLSSDSVFQKTYPQHKPMFTKKQTLDLYDSKWTFVFKSTPAFDANIDRLTPFGILFSGLAISFLSLMYIRSEAKVQRQAQTLAAKLTAQLQKETAIIRAITDSAYDAIIMLDSDGNVAFWNPAAERIFGYSKEEITGKNLHQILAPDQDFTLYKDNFEKFTQTGSGTVIGKTLRLSGIRKDGRQISIELSISTVHLDNEWQAIGIIRDITEQVKAEEELKKTNEILSMTSRMGRIGGWELNLLTQELFWSDMVKEIHQVPTDYKPDLQGALNFYEEGESRNKITEAVNRCIQTGEPFDIEARLITAKGNRLWVRAIGKAEFKNDKCVRLFGTFQDITEQKQVELELKENQVKLQQIISSSPTVIYSLNPCNFSPLWISSNLPSVTGFTVDEALQPNWWHNHIHPDDKQEALTKLAMVINEDVAACEYRFYKKNGELMWIHDEIKAIRDAEGKITELIGAWIDTTERKRIEQERMEFMAAQLENRAKREFISNMSHEIRTPLNAILGFAQVLEQDPSLTPKQTKQVHAILSSGQHLLNLINDILDFSKIEAGKLYLNTRNFSLRDLIYEIEMMFNSRAKAKNLELQIRIYDNVPEYVTADDGKLRQVLVNLVGNAVKFTQSGRVTVGVKVEPGQEEISRTSEIVNLVIEVEDTGPGISQEEIERLFKPFIQAKAGLTMGGTGLGLSICKKLIEFMGGTITINSKVGHGTSVRFVVPVKVGEEIIDTQIKKYQGRVIISKETKPPRVLVVEDQAINRDLLQAILDQLGCEIKEAENGLEAIRIINDWIPDIILMDMRMPVMDGFEAIKIIRSTESGKKIKIVALTASVFKTDVEKIFRTGADSYLAKPFKVEELYAIFEKLLGIKFVYTDTEKKAKFESKELTNDDIIKLPDQLRNSMKSAIESGDMGKFKELISELENIDIQVANSLKELANQYNYDKLLMLFK